ncbi:hypothetical protein [Chitinimonas prasina]|uniref:hypothetical protein n=1 Tax=Chitinimonas prasina TaxID=1434937 RepID=UPI0024E1412C|nr:hypothetical protein [Chitinimonas prasina]
MSEAKPNIRGKHWASFHSAQSTVLVQRFATTQQSIGEQQQALRLMVSRPFPGPAALLSKINQALSEGQ